MKLYLGILTGLIIYAIIGSLGLYLLKVCWAGYNTASKDKSYTLEMLVLRLLIAMPASVTAGMCVSKVTNNKGRSSWFVAAIVFSIAAYIHFARVWRDYPAWYHFAYLVPIIPTIVLSDHFLNKQNKLNNITHR